MKSIVNRMLVVMVVGALTSVAAFAKVHKQRVNFENDIKVNGTLVKKGNYDLKFDDETGQLSIVKNGKTITTIRSVFSPYVTSCGISRENSFDASAGGRKGVHTTFHTRMGTVSAPQLKT